MRLVFVGEKIPRSTTRAQWRELHRWRRTTERALAEANARAIANLVAYGSTMPETLHARAVDRLVNPPLIVYPEPPAIELTAMACATCGASYGHSPSCAARRALMLNDPRIVGLFAKIGRELGDPADMAALDRRFDEAREGGE